MKYNEITKIVNVKEYIETLHDRCLIIYSKTSLKKNNINLERSNFIIYSTEELTVNKEKIDQIISSKPNVDKIICVGGGTAIDIGKYLAKKFSIKLICIPTMLSTNAYATNKVSLYVNKKKETLDSNLPTEILLDKEILDKSQNENLYGFADIFSIYTALNDWLLAVKYNNESITPEFYEAKQLLHSVNDYVLNSNVNEIAADILFIYNSIGKSGDITNEYGSGKPESGSEHIFAKALEREIKIPHAIAVANGILLMSIAQAIYLDIEIDFNPYLALNKIGIYELNKRYNIGFDLIEKVFLNLKPREDRYTVVDIINKDFAIKNRVLDEYKKYYEVS